MPAIRNTAATSKYLHLNVTVANQAKCNRWACPFHLPRMHFKCWKLLEVMARHAAKPRPLTGDHQQISL